MKKGGCVWILYLFLYLTVWIQPVFAQKASVTSGHFIRQHTSYLDDEPLELIDIDTLFYIENNGLTRILVNLNGRKFKFVVDPAEVNQSVNAFLIPASGEITVNIAAYIRKGQENVMVLTSQGPEGSTAEIIIGDLLLPGQVVAYAVEDLQPLPETFRLLQSYPNPFIDETTITYEFSETRPTGARVTMTLYDVMGRRVRVLVDAIRYPGKFTAVWDGTNAAGTHVAAGMYFCLMETEEVYESIQLILVR